jgi:hypothetical protein
VAFKNKLQHHPTKTKVMFIASSYNLINKIGNMPLILMNNTPVPRTSKYTCLGMDIDEKLTWNAHIDSICSKVSAGIAWGYETYKALCPTCNSANNLQSINSTLL